MGEDHEFYGGIKSYDVHTYYGNEKEEKLAFALREKVLKDFAKEIENGDKSLQVLGKTNWSTSN